MTNNSQIVIYHTIPDWYEDASATGFNSLLLAQSLRQFNGSWGG